MLSRHARIAKIRMGSPRSFVTVVLDLTDAGHLVEVYRAPTPGWNERARRECSWWLSRQRVGG
jgi:hypothetical protein